jgi:hypothetical protein
MKVNCCFAVRCCILCFLLMSPLYAQDDAPGFSQEERATLAIVDVPQHVLATARLEGPDVFFDGAESYWVDDFRVYRLSGRLFREVWHVHVREDGKLLRTERDNQDD